MDSKNNVGVLEALDPNDFWVRHSKINKLLRNSKIGLMGIGIVCATGIGVVLALTEMAFTVIFSGLKGNMFGILNIIFLVGDALKLGFQNVMGGATPEINQAQMNKINTYAENIAVGFIHIMSAGVVGNINFMNEANFGINMVFSHPWKETIGGRAGTYMIKGLIKEIQHENEMIKKLNDNERSISRDNRTQNAWKDHRISPSA